MLFFCDFKYKSKTSKESRVKNIDRTNADVDAEYLINKGLKLNNIAAQKALFLSNKNQVT